MGLVDKVLVAFKEWTVYEVESLPAPSNDLRATLKHNKEAHRLSIIAETDARRADELAGNAPESKAAVIAAKEVRICASKEETKAKANCKEMVKRHNTRLFSLSQAFDVIFRSHNIRKEHYHGGKCNGVNCIRIMEKAKELFVEFAVAMKEKKVEDVADEVIENKCLQFARLFGLLDAVWSNVRGIDAGLLQTDSQVELLRKVLLEAKQLWIAMGISTWQPKWHMTFDGHLLNQVITCGGLADKSDESIELQHQT